MSANKCAIDPAPLGGCIVGADFRAGKYSPHGKVEVAFDEPFSTSLGKNARVLVVPDEPKYRAAPTVTDALVTLLALVDLKMGNLASDTREATAKARAALRAAGVLP